MKLTFLSILFFLAIGGTIATLFYGIFTMVRQGKEVKSNKLMQIRIVFQAIALVLFAYFLWKSNNG